MAEIYQNTRVNTKTNKIITRKVIRDGHTETIRTYETDKSGIEKLVSTESRDIK